MAGYLGNSKLKEIGIPIEWTPELITEYQKCAADPIYFAEKYIKIVHPDDGLIPIRLYDYQKEIVESITHNRRVVVNTARQSGKTTTAVCVILHYILFNKYKTVGILSNKNSSALDVMDRLQTAYENLPHWIQQGVLEWNKGNIEIENGSKVIAAASSSSSVRGKTLTLLYIDETAFLENWDEFYASVFPTITSGKKTKLLFTSTPKGLNHFHKICDLAQKGKNGFIYIEVPWNRVPGRDEAWKEETLAAINFNYEIFEQEYNVSFIGSSGSLVSSRKLSTLVDKEPIAMTENLRQYERPEKNKSYALIADVSRGKGLDYSAFSVIDVTQMPYEQVCVFRDNMVGPVDYATIIHRVANLYNEALVLVELNDIGGQVADTLAFDLGYENVVYTESAGRAGKRISSGFGKAGIDNGIRTTKSVKATGCSVLKMLVEQEQMILNDKFTIDELKKFSKKGLSYEAEKGSHDDLVMTLVLFSWMTDQHYFKELTDINTMHNLREKSEEEIEEELLGFFVSNGIPDEEHDEPPRWF